MKSLFAATLVSTLVFSVFANAGSLDGTTFCRTVKMGGFGRPAPVEGKHCVSFKNDVATDNANTFFGNPPESFAYVVDGNKIINATKNKPSGYEIQGDELVVPETGAILIRQ